MAWSTFAITQGAHVVVTTLHRRLFVTFERRHDVVLRVDVTNVGVVATLRRCIDVVATLFVMLTGRHWNVINQRRFATVLRRCSNVFLWCCHNVVWRVDVTKVGVVALYRRCSNVVCDVDRTSLERHQSTSFCDVIATLESDIVRTLPRPKCHTCWRLIFYIYNCLILKRSCEDVFLWRRTNVDMVTSLLLFSLNVTTYIYLGLHSRSRSHQMPIVQLKLYIG